MTNCRPLYRFKDFYTDVDLDGIFHCEMDLNKITDDTTSMVMWGEYDTPEGKLGVISINFGHSKQKKRR